MGRKLEPARRRDHLVIEVCLHYCEMFELPCPSRIDVEYKPLGVLMETFWWRQPCLDESDTAFVARNPRAIKNWSELYPCEDRLDCMAAICGTLAGRLVGQRTFVCQIMNIGPVTFWEAKTRWRAETPEYRWMMSHLAGDLKHKGLRELVLGHGNRNAHRDTDRQR